MIVHICPDCGSRYVSQAAHMERLLADLGSIKWCNGPATGADNHPKPVACAPVSYVPAKRPKRAVRPVPVARTEDLSDYA